MHRVAAGVGEQPGQDRAPAHDVDDEVRGQRPAALVADAGDPQTAVGPLRGQRGHGHAAADLDARLLVGGAREHVLERGPPRGGGDEPLVARSHGAVGDRLRQAGHQVEPQAAGVLERGQHIGQLGGEHGAPARVDEVRLAELRDAGAGPPVPREHGGLGHGRGITLQDGHAMTVARQHHCRGEAARSGAEHDRLGQGTLPLVG